MASALRKAPWTMALAHAVYRNFQPKYTVGVVGVIFNSEGHVLLVEHVFHPRRPWGLPGGWTHWNEAPSDTVIRELREELEIEPEIVAVLVVERRQRNHLDIAYLCELNNGAIGKLSPELLNYGWFDPRSLPKLVPFHQVAIRRALKMLESQRNEI